MTMFVIISTTALVITTIIGISFVMYERNRISKITKSQFDSIVKSAEGDGEAIQALLRLSFENTRDLAHKYDYRVSRHYYNDRYYTRIEN